MFTGFADKSVEKGVAVTTWFYAAKLVNGLK
jgi:hypothetical protein